MCLKAKRTMAAIVTGIIFKFQNSNFTKLIHGYIHRIMLTCLVQQKFPTVTSNYSLPVKKTLGHRWYGNAGS